jgi:hypothetical protein
MDMTFAASNGSQLSIEAIILPLQVEAGKSHRLVSYSEVMQQLKYGDQSERYLGIYDVQWINIGAGVPSSAPKEAEA